MKKQIDKKCKDCLHYKMCLERFRKLKKKNQYILIGESEYFALADDCEFHIKASDVVAEIFAWIDEARERWESVYGKDHFGYGGDAYGYLQTDVYHTIYELKKKYESEEAK